MKKVIVSVFCLFLTGCFEDSGYLVKTCSKIETANDLSSTITYTFGFKEDIIDDLKVLYDYTGDINTISSIKLSYETQNKFFEDIVYNLMVDTDNQYKIQYKLDVDKDYYDKFIISNKRSELVSMLEKEKFICE